MLQCCITPLCNSAEDNKLAFLELLKTTQAKRSLLLHSMESPKWKPISYMKAGVLKVDQVEPPVLKGASVRFDLSKDECIK